MSRETTYKSTWGEILAMLALLPVIVVWKGYVAVQLWAWFVIPLGVAMISIPQAIGLMLLVELVKPYRLNDDKNHPPSHRTIIYAGVSLLSPAFALFLGWIVQAFMG